MTVARIFHEHRLGRRLSNFRDRGIAEMPAMEPRWNEVWNDSTIGGMFHE